MPSYNSGAMLARSVAAVQGARWPLWVVIDGSTDGSDAGLADGPGLRVMRRAQNGGKGAAVLTGLRAAVAEGFSHVLVMDADGQHPAEKIVEFFDAAKENPEAVILGVPLFDARAPWIRVWGRRISNCLLRLETGRDIGDALFGFRVYPAAALLAVMQGRDTMRRYDFDTEVLARLCWAGVPLVKRAAPVRYFGKDEGGISHFRYGWDNLALAAMHVRLIAARLFRPCRH